MQTEQLWTLTLLHLWSSMNNARLLSCKGYQTISCAFYWIRLVKDLLLIQFPDSGPNDGTVDIMVSMPSFKPCRIFFEEAEKTTTTTASILYLLLGVSNPCKLFLSLVLFVATHTLPRRHAYAMSRILPHRILSDFFCTNWNNNVNEMEKLKRLLFVFMLLSFKIILLKPT